MDYCEKITKEFDKTINHLLGKDALHIEYKVLARRGIQNSNLAYKLTTELLKECGKTYADIELIHDSSGAPAINVYDVTGNVMKQAPFISLTDEGNISAGLVMLQRNDNQTEESQIIGVGIDIADIQDVTGMLKVSRERLSRYFGKQEIDALSRMAEKEAGIYAATLVSKGEAAFKSMSAVYDKYRKKNDNHPLPVSFVDFTFYYEDAVIPQRMTADICKKEGLQIHATAFCHDNVVGAVSICRK